MRVLYAKVGHAHCPKCLKEISAQSPEQITELLLKFPVNEEIHILSPIVIDRKGEYQKELYDLRQSGFTKVKIDGEVKELSQDIHLDKNKKHNIDVYVDRLILKPGIENRLKSSIETSIHLSHGLIKLERKEKETLLLSTKFSCAQCKIGFPDIDPRLFSFNSPIGSCPNCKGIGLQYAVMLSKDFLDSFLDSTWEDFPSDFEAASKNELCHSCRGQRLRPEALSVTIQNRTIADVCNLSLSDTLSFFKTLKLSDREKKIAGGILKETINRLNFLILVGVEYLTLNRSASTLSGGEGRRIRLAAQLGSSLTGVLYVLDEPSIGLHAKDNSKLISALKDLRNLGNTILTVEHDKETILNADHIIDLGPGAGINGGNVVSQGNLKKIASSERSLTGAYLSGRKKIPDRSTFRKPTDACIIIEGASQNNLKNISVKIPLGLLTCVTGVSGSGKSTLILDTLFHACSNKLYNSKYSIGKHSKISGLENIESVIDVNQSPIGRTPRSNPATYTGVFSHVRALFAGLPESKIRGYKVGRYSFNIPGGRCEACHGVGLMKLEMHFLPDMYVQCESCQGKRYNRETLEVRFKDHNISEFLSMTIDEAIPFFKHIPAIKTKLDTLQSVGLGYIGLGQQATTLSGGEAQRIKLAKELSKNSHGKALFILDEPTTGLHFDDIHKLLDVLQKLVDLGNTIIVIEHNLDVIKSADYIIDLGPEGGQNGGTIVATGSPIEVSKNPTSFTGQYLQKLYTT